MWILPLLGLIFLPYATIMCVLVWNIATGVSGWDRLWFGLDVVLDIMKWAQIVSNRRGIPGYAESYP
jgi:hypothetical protein